MGSLDTGVSLAAAQMHRTLTTESVCKRDGWMVRLQHGVYELIEPRRLIVGYYRAEVESCVRIIERIDSEDWTIDTEPLRRRHARPIGDAESADAEGEAWSPVAGVDGIPSFRPPGADAGHCPAAAENRIAGQSMPSPAAAPAGAPWRSAWNALTGRDRST